MFSPSLFNNASEYWQKLKNAPPAKQNQIFSLLFIFASFTYSMIYCHFYVNFFLGGTTTFFDSLMWALRKFGLWWGAIPLLLNTFSTLFSQKLRYILALYIGTIGAGTLYSVLLDYLIFDPDIKLVTSLVIFLPTHIGTATFVVLMGFLIQFGAASLQSSITEPAPQEPPQDLSVKSIRVQTGTQDLDLPINQIESVSAAGNYMEVCSEQKTYIMRITMKELEETLCPAGFLRIHRSHLVNGQKIQRVKGSQSITTISGKELPISQRYKKNIIGVQALN